KADFISSADTAMMIQADQKRNPDHRITVTVPTETKTTLGDYCECYQGVVTGDINRFVSKFWEIPEFTDDVWSFCKGAGNGIETLDGLDDVIRWEGGAGSLHRYAAETRDKLHDMH